MHGCSFFSLSFSRFYPSLLCRASSTRALNGNESLWSEVHLWVITRPGELMSSGHRNEFEWKMQRERERKKENRNLPMRFTFALFGTRCFSTQLFSFSLSLSILFSSSPFSTIPGLFDSRGSLAIMLRDIAHSRSAIRGM